MTRLKLEAGEISVELDSDNESAEELAAVAHNEMDWMMAQWSDVSGKCVREHPSFINLG